MSFPYGVLPGALLLAAIVLAAVTVWLSPFTSSSSGPNSGTVATQPPQALTLPWGDVDCDLSVNIGDAVKVARHLIELEVTQASGCHPIAASVAADETIHRFADVDCSGAVSISDAIKLARHLAELPVSQEEGCPGLGASTSVYAVENGFFLAATGTQANFSSMTDFEQIPGSDQALILTQDGYIHRVFLDDPDAEPQLFADMSDMIEEGQVEEGLLTLIFDPAYPDDPYVYVYYNAPRPEGVTGFYWYYRLSRFEVDLSDMVLDLESEHIILDLEGPIFAHNGGGPIGFGNDSYLYVAVGDGGFFNEWNSQDKTNLFGTMLRIDIHNPPPGQTYGIPDDNPFVDDPDAMDEIWAYGLRNPWRGSIDPVTGEIWIGDVGDGWWEEVNKIVPAGNYGWPIIEGFECWEKLDPPELCQEPEDHVPPRSVYQIRFMPDCAIMGGFVYRGTQFPELDGYFIYADYCTGRVRALDTQDESAEAMILADTRMDGEEPDPIGISSIGLLEDGELVFVSYNSEGIRRLERIQ